MQLLRKHLDVLAATDFVASPAARPISTGVTTLLVVTLGAPSGAEGGGSVPVAIQLRGVERSVCDAIDGTVLFSRPSEGNRGDGNDKDSGELHDLICDLKK